MAAIDSHPLGVSIPAAPHAVSVSLPQWKDNVDYEEGDPRVANVMETGYPRFFVHKSIQKLANVALERFGKPNEFCYLYPSASVAKECLDFLHSRDPDINVHSVEFVVCKGSKSSSGQQHDVVVYAVIMPEDKKSLGKEFWQHSGAGISSRVAEHCLSRLASSSPVIQPSTALPSTSSSSSAAASLASSPPDSQPMSRNISRNRHYAKKTVTPMSNNNTISTTANIDPSANGADYNDQTKGEVDQYVEERYGRNLSTDLAPLAKSALRKRIAGVLNEDLNNKSTSNQDDSPKQETLSTSQRGVASVTENDVYLYSSGMNAIYNAHRLCLGLLNPNEEKKSVCFGFPYTDTLKILQKWGPGCIHLGNGLDEDIDHLEKDVLQKEPILGLYCEFPSNPLLRSPNLGRLRKLADKYGFLLVVDETIGNFVNVEMLPYADMVASSLTKVFSGDSNVLSGSLILNPNGKYYSKLKELQNARYEDNFFDQDAIFLERNSRDYRPRIKRINKTTEELVDHLVRRYSTQSISSPCPFAKANSTSCSSTNPSICLNPGTSLDSGDLSKRPVKQIYYPKYISSSNYEACSRKGQDDAAGYGGLFSITFHSDKMAQVFYDNLSCCKGPSLGTNFTLASPYTILAHYAELDWAQSWGVEPALVRVSVGLEDPSKLISDFDHAIDCAVQAYKNEH